MAYISILKIYSSDPSDRIQTFKKECFPQTILNNGQSKRGALEFSQTRQHAQYINRKGSLPL